MGLSELISILNNRLAYLATQRAEAFSRGDLTMMAALDADSATTTATLHILQSAA
jgi:hypothetical protein